VAGTWTTTENVNATACGEGTYYQYYTYAVTQSGCNITVVPQGTTLQFSGTVNGNQLSWSGSYPESGGTTTINSLTLTVSADGNTFTGSSSWTWRSSGGSTCSGTTQVIGTRRDTQAPTVPTNLTVTVVSSSQINLSWTAPTDNVAVVGYKIYRNGVYLKSVTGTSTTDTGLTANTQYCYQVTAYDAANNESGKSTQACGTTPAVNVQGPGEL